MMTSKDIILMTEKWWCTVDRLTHFHVYFHSYFHSYFGFVTFVTFAFICPKSEREALEGHRTLVLTSSQALPDCALNCSSFFLNDTLFAVATLSLMRSLQFTCVNSALIRSWFRKAQQVPCLLLWFCLAFLFIATVQMWWVAALLNAVLLWIRPSTCSRCWARPGHWSFVDNCRKSRRAMSRAGPSHQPGGTSKGQVLRSAFHFQKNS